MQTGSSSALPVPVGLTPVGWGWGWGSGGVEIDRKDVIDEKTAYKTGFFCVIWLSRT